MTDQKARTITIAIGLGDALAFRTDVLAVKYAQALYGVDQAVVERFSKSGQDVSELLPKPAEFRLVDSHNQIAARAVLFVGVKPLHQFGYQEIRRFGRRVLSSLAVAMPNIKQVCLTLHGPGYGLDEAESFQAEIAGLLDAIASGDFPKDLDKITVIECNHARAERLRTFLSRLIPHNIIHLNEKDSLESFGETPDERLRAAGYESASKPNIFVAMPFSDDMEDTFHYGIQGAVNAAGYLCERADSSVFTGDVMEWVKKRIASASLIIADLSNTNPNVYLEVGYAWGCGKPTVLLVRDPTELKFDVKGQRCIVYKKIKDLEESLRKELEAL